MLMKTGILLSLVLLASYVCSAQTQQDPDWPCIQVLVPEISAASIWDGPSIEEIADPGIFRPHARELVSAVVEKHEPLTESQLDKYIARFDADQRNAALTFLFNSLLDSFNSKRHGQIKSIKLYTKTQIKSARVIERLMEQKVELENRQASAEQLAEVESQLHWQKRMFKEREKSFDYLCELPQEIAQQAGEAARAISAKLAY